MNWIMIDEVGLIDHDEWNEWSLQAELTRQQNEFKIKLKELEDSLLSRLSSAGGNFLSDTALVENLETTKQTATEIEKKVEEAKVTEKKINEARENYRPAASRASLLYFILNDLEKINPLYQFSLKASKHEHTTTSSWGLVALINGSSWLLCFLRICLSWHWSRAHTRREEHVTFHTLVVSGKLGMHTLTFSLFSSVLLHCIEFYWSMCGCKKNKT